MSECPRCGAELKDLPRHALRVHPEERWLKRDEDPPHHTAMKITMEQDFNSQGAEIYIVTEGAWLSERYGFRHHGWFIPIEIEEDNE